VASTTKVQKQQRPALPPLDPSKLYSPEEAAPYLRLTVRQVVRRLDARHIGFVKPDRKRYIMGTQILVYLGEKTTNPRPEHLRPDLRNA
jgi:excisionase family DNA binding protein